LQEASQTCIEGASFRLIQAKGYSGRSPARLPADRHDIDFLVTIQIRRRQVLHCHSAVFDDLSSPFGSGAVLSLVDAHTTPFLGLTAEIIADADDQLIITVAGDSRTSYPHNHLCPPQEDIAGVAQQYIDAVNAGVQGEITRLQGVVDDITAGWKGEAANAYHQLQTQVNTDATRLNDILRSIKEAIDLTSRNYAQSDEEQRTSLASRPAGRVG